MFDFEYGEDVTLHRYVKDGDAPRGGVLFHFEDIPLENVAVFPGTSKEIDDGKSTRVLTGKTLISSDNIVVKSQDEVTVQGTRYKVDGDSSSYRVHPLTGDSFGTKIQLRRTHG